MSEAELIGQAKLDWDEEVIETLKDALEVMYTNGSFDEVGGDVEAPTGHYYQIDRWIVVTDIRGNHTIHTHESIEEAEAAFDELEAEYEAWTDDEENFT